MVREKICFDENWLFYMGDIAVGYSIRAGQTNGVTDISDNDNELYKVDENDKRKSLIQKDKWYEVNLPHDWSVYCNFSIEKEKMRGYIPRVVGCYRKVFNISDTDEGKNIILEFEGVFRNSTVWVNGHLIGNHKSGYTSFYYDITDFLRYGKEGENVIFVKVDATESEGWWCEGCGIYRHVWLHKSCNLSIKQYGTYVTTPLVSRQRAEVVVDVTVQNKFYEDKKFILKTLIFDADNLNIVGKEIQVYSKAFSDNTFSCELEVINPNLWSPDSPYLYKVVNQILLNGELVDEYETVLGVRSIEFTNDKGFFINGENCDIKGTCNHQDFAGVGIALPDSVIEYKIKLLKEMGCNAYRSAHHPASPALLDICDRLGMLVMDENRMLASGENGFKELEAMILRDRNHPSIILWSMENEEPIEGTPIGSRILKSMNEFTHKLDPSRPTTAGICQRWNEEGYSDIVDITGYNYGQRDDQYITDHVLYPQRKMICSESTSSTTTRGIYENDETNCYCSSYETLIPSWGCSHEKTIKDFADNKHLTGVFVWTGFDYRGEPTPYEWPCVTSHFGIMDLCGLPKDAYYYYKSVWTNEPMVHIMPHWDWDVNKKSIIPVRVFSNCESVELFLNGESLGEKSMISNGHLEWNVAYLPGKLEAIAKKGGNVEAKMSITTTKTAYGIKLFAEKSYMNFDGKDTCVVRIAIVDEDGSVVPYADNLVSFKIEGGGKIIGVGNGNPSSHEPDKAESRRAFNGWCIAIIQSDMQTDEKCIRLTASSAGINGSSINIMNKSF